MAISIDTTAAEEKLRRLKRVRLIGGTIAMREGAEYLADRVREAVPVVTGHLKSTVTVDQLSESRVAERQTRWVVRIPADQFDKFFYAMFFLPLFRDLVQQHASAVKQLGKATMLRVVRSWMR